MITSGAFLDVELEFAEGNFKGLKKSYMKGDIVPSILAYVKLHKIVDEWVNYREKKIASLFLQFRVSSWPDLVF